MTTLKDCQSFRVSEIFVSIEGEGPYTGQPTAFVRFFGCNLTCPGFGTPQPAEAQTLERFKMPMPPTDEMFLHSTGCDSTYSWHPSYKPLYDLTNANEVVDKLIELYEKTPFRVLSFTGGEPMMFEERIVEISNLLRVRAGYDPKLNPVTADGLSHLMILVETNGTIKPTDELGYLPYPINYAVSLKLSNSGETEERRLRKGAIEAFRDCEDNTYFKFVVRNSAESYAEVAEVCKRFNLPTEYVWLMPEGSTVDQQAAIQQDVAEHCLTMGYNFCARVHCWVFNNKKGT